MAGSTDRVKVKTPPFRVSFPSVFAASSYDGGAPKFSCVALWYPAKFTPDQKVAWAKVKEILDVASTEKFKKKVKDLPDNYKRSLRKGEEKAHLDGYGPGCVFATLSSKMKPGLLGMDKMPIMNGEDEFYAGCWAMATVTAYAYDNKGKGVALGLHNLLKLADDTNFSGRASAEEDFGDEATEFSGGGSANEDDDPLG